MNRPQGRAVTLRLLSVLSMILPLCFGCALQSSVVDLEQEVQTTREMQQEMITLREQMEQMVRAMEKSPAPANDAESRGMLLGKINLIEQHLQRLEGRLEEEGYKTSETKQAMDNQADQVNQLTARLDMLEKQRSAITASSSQTTPIAPTPPEGTQGKSTSTAEQAAPGSSMSRGGSKDYGVSPQEAYRLAYNDYLSGKYDLAILNFRTYISKYPDSVFLPEALYWMGQSYYSQAHYHEAAQFFQEMEKRYPKHDLIPNALLKTALAYAALGDTSSAKTFFTKVVEKFPQSDAALRAKGELSGGQGGQPPF